MTIMPSAIPFVDLAAQQRRIGDRIDARMQQVLAHGQYIMGPEIKQLEAALSAFTGARHAVTCASGTDALLLVLLARGVGPGQAVLVPSLTFCATAEVVALLGATPVFTDVDEATFNMDPDSLEAGIAIARTKGLEPIGIIPVDLYGLPSDYNSILAVAARNEMFVASDAAQALGASYCGKKVGTLGLATATSFFPAKPLGCYGDGGAVFTDDAELAGGLRSLRVHGQGSHKYDNVRIGIAGRMDTLQAAILLAKLEVFEDELAARQRIAARYNDGFAGNCRFPHVPERTVSAWAQYTLQVPATERDRIASALKAEGIPTGVYYPLGLHQQAAYKHFPRASPELPVTERLVREVLSLPFHPYLEPDVQDRIIDAVIKAMR